MQKKNGALLFSPSDLITFVSDTFSSWMDRRYIQDPTSLVRDVADEGAKLIQKHGILHEKDYLDTLFKEGKDVCIIEGTDDAAFEQTVAAMKSGREIIYQGFLRMEQFAGLSDFLVRSAGASKLGDYHYEVWDSKLAKKPKPYFLVQLCCYAEMLELIQGRLPDIAVVLGSKETKRFRTLDYYYYYLSLKKRFLEFQENFSIESPPEWMDVGAHSKWTEEAARLLEERDDLIRVANIRKSQIKKLKRTGIDTMTRLANATEDGCGYEISPRTFQTLRKQAELQIESASLDKPAYEMIPLSEYDGKRRGLGILPPPSKLDVYFDMEGYPHIDGGLEYLFGAVHHDGDGGTRFIDWWAHDRNGEKIAFEEFIDWVYARWTEDRQMHIYHYATYEVSAMRRLASRHATRERELDDLLRSETFVDLYAVVRQGLRLGCNSYSIKKVELLYMEGRKAEVSTAVDSIVFYEHWLEESDGATWKESATLKQIRDYNQVDCESTAALCKWLRERQSEIGIEYTGPVFDTEEKKPPKDPSLNELLAKEILAKIPSDRSDDPERWRVTELLAHMLCFHEREAKVSAWEFFDRLSKSEEELFADPECIAFTQRTATPPLPEKKSLAFEYKFDIGQDIKLVAGDKVVWLADRTVKAEVMTIDEDRGLLVLKHRDELMPDGGHWILSEMFQYQALEQSLFRQVQKLWNDGTLNSCLSDLLFKEIPRIKNVVPGQAICASEKYDGVGNSPLDLVQQTIKAVEKLDNSYLSIQGPPGTGKTFVASRAIVHLMKQGKRIGVSSNSHKAIENLLQAVGKAAQESGFHFSAVKIGKDKTSGKLEFENKDIKIESELKNPDDYQLIGATAWTFAKELLADKLDYLFIDEAGQVCLANIVAMGECAKNIVLMGDQLQLEQPVRGSHPGESGTSSLEYLLGDSGTISHERGIFLDTSHRMHPAVCELVSSAVYDGRLRAATSTENNRIILHPSAQGLQASGVLFMPVEHEGNSQSSSEEVEQISFIIEQLLLSQFEKDGIIKKITLKDDVLIVAPYNRQVRLIKQKIPAATVGSVDKFQGREAPVVIVSMAASDLSNCPRGIDFLLSKKRLNVAISRAQILAIVVGSPALSQFACNTVEQAALLNFYCRIMLDGQKNAAISPCGIVSLTP